MEKQISVIQQSHIQKDTHMETFLSYVATIWFFVILNSYLVWNSLAPVIHFLPALFIVTGTITISHRLSLSKHNIILILWISFFFFWIIISLCDNLASIIKRSTDFIPMLCIILWPKELILRTYKIIRRVIIFYAIGSSILSLLILFGQNERLPHLILPPREALHEKIGMVYYLYGLFIADCHPILGVSSRACGMLQEPGHFSIVLGFIYLIDRFSGQKANWWIVICGILTFSSTFILIAIFTEIHNLFSFKNVKKVLKIIPVLILLTIVLYSFLPVEIQEKIEYFAYGRNLENVVEAFNETSSLTEALDERASVYSISNYEQMTTTQYIFGGGQKDEGDMLSDYRGMILQMGLIGVFFSTMVYLIIMAKTPLKMKIALGFAYFLVIIHRAWMLNQPYIFFLAFLAVAIYKNTKIDSYRIRNIDFS